MFIQIASTMRKCARIRGPTLWKFPPVVEAWRNSTTTTYFGPACHTDECNINKLQQSKQTEKARQWSKQIRDGLRRGDEEREEEEAPRGDSAYLRAQFKFMVTPGPTLGFGLGLLRRPNVTGRFGCQGRNEKPKLATRAG